MYYYLLLVFNINDYSSPQKMDLSAADELIVADHLDVFEKNGFRLSVDQEAPPAQRVKLHTVPHSKSVVFNSNGM
jgi:DNA mismatch repair protein PMS2